MSEFKKYMLLNLKNGGMIYEHPTVITGTIKKIAESEGVSVKCIKMGHDIGNPIPYTTLSNMLISLIGGIPVPTKPSRAKNFPIKRLEFCDEMAKNSYYKITSPVDPNNNFVKQVIGDDGDYYGIVNKESDNCGGEFMQSRKSAINSNRKEMTVLYTDENGDEVSVPGVYDFSMLLRLFNDDKNNPGYVRFISFLNELLNVSDVRTTYTFCEMVRLLHDMSYDDSYIEKVKNFYNEIVSLWDKGGNQSVWFRTVFNYDAKKNGKYDGKKRDQDTSNINLIESYNIDSTIPKTYLRNNIGDKKKRIQIDGEIIVPIYDENVYNMLLNGVGFCTFLEGGVCEVVRFADEKNELYLVDYESEWTKIH